MNITLIGATKTILSNPGSKLDYFAWPTVKRLQNGRIAVAASGFRRRHVCPFGKTVIAFSENDGETYSLPAPVIDTVLDDRDGGLCPFGESGLIVSSFNNKVEQQREWNRSYTANGWDEQPKEAEQWIEGYLNTVTPEEEAAALGVTYKVSSDCGVTFGPLRKSPVSSPHGPIELHDGTVLWLGTKDDLDKVFAYRIDPISGEAEYVGKIDSAPIYDDIKPEGKLVIAEPYTIELPDHTLLCHIRVDPVFTTFQSVSRDGGKTWSAPKRIMEDYGGAPMHLLQHSSGMLIGVCGVRKAPCGIKAIFSSDNGETWECGNDYLYHDEIGTDLGYPSSVELKDGTIATVFYTRPGLHLPAVVMQQKWTFEK